MADLGISKFKGKGPARQDSADKNARGTRTYGRQCSTLPTSFPDVYMQVPLKVTGLMARMCMTLYVKGRTPIYGL